MGLLSELMTFGGFLAGLPPFVRHRLSLEEARQIIQRRVRDREANFLATVEQGILANPGSPYVKLLQMAHCGVGDLRQMVRDQGLEATLRSLREAGVYLTFEEFKGQQPIVRNGLVIESRPADFDNPRFRRYHRITTGGSTGSPRSVLMDLDHLKARVPIQLLIDEFHGLRGIPNAFWFEIPPGNGLDSVLLRAPCDNMPERWFTPIKGGRDGAALRFRLATAASVAVARCSGAKVPLPEHLPLGRAEVLAEWAGGTLRVHGRCAIRAHVSKLLRIAVAAQERDIDLSGAVLVGGGEPPTAAKVRQITSTGARFLSTYYFSEAGPVGLACTTADDPNDQHLMKDHLAMVQARRLVPDFDVAVDVFCFTTLLPTAPKLLLNVESDDYGVAETRACGCPFESLGFTQHLREIRSYRKLTGEGMTLIGSDIERILEEDLPARFGGSALDYQLVETEDERGFTGLQLLASPRLTIPDEAALVETILAALSRAGAAAEMSQAIWRQGGNLRVIREEPRVTSRGKLMPLMRAGQFAAKGAAASLVAATSDAKATR